MDNTEVKTLKTAVYTRRAVDKYRAANKDKIKEYKAAYYQKNKERLSALARERHQAKKSIKEEAKD